MRITNYYTDQRSKKLTLFRDLVQECQLSVPGSRLSEKLKKKMESFGKEERRDVVAQTAEGCAPLFLACKNGSADVVDYLVSTCGADLEQRGVFEVAEEGVSHSVTPLWCAAVAGRISVVKVLIRHGADINAASDSGSTPVRSACYIVRPGLQTAHMDIVRCLVRAGADLCQSNHFGGTCLINSVQSPELVQMLVDSGRVEVNAQDIQRKTALHYAVQENRADSAKILLAAGADPDLRSKYGDDVLQTACLKGALHIFNHLLETVMYEPARVADAFELMGTTFLMDFHDIGSTLFFWRKALEIRYEGSYRHYPKKIVNVDSPHPVLGMREFNSKEDLDEDINGEPKAMKVQALLITERILGLDHKDTIFRYMYAGAAHADTHEYQQCVRLWNHALKLKATKETLLSCDTAFTARAIVQLYINVVGRTSVSEDSEDHSDTPVTFTDVLTTAHHLNEGMEEALGLLEARPAFLVQANNFDIILTAWIHTVHMLLKLASSTEEHYEVLKVVMPVLKMDPVTSLQGDGLLHLAVSSTSTLRSNSFLDGDESVQGMFPSLPVARFIIMCGYDVHARNNIKETPLHMAAKRDNFCPEVTHLLLEAGAHLDTPDARDICPQDIFKTHPCKVNLVPYTSLKCLAVTTVLRQRVLFRGCDLPSDLHSHINMHIPSLPPLCHEDHDEEDS